LVAFVLQRLQDRRGKAEVGKGCQLLVLSRGRALAARTTCFEAQRNARIALRHPACPGLSDEILGALNRRTIGAPVPSRSSFTRLERCKSLIERWQLVSCRGAQVKFLYKTAEYAALAQG
jgi:hypothetical protein